MRLVWQLDDAPRAARFKSLSAGSLCFGNALDNRSIFGQDQIEPPCAVGIGGSSEKSISSKRIEQDADALIRRLSGKQVSIDPRGAVMIPYGPCRPPWTLVA